MRRQDVLPVVFYGFGNCFFRLIICGFQMWLVASVWLADAALQVSELQLVEQLDVGVDCLIHLGNDDILVGGV